MKKSFLGMLLGSTLLMTGCGPTVSEIMEFYDQDLVTGNFEKSMPHIQERILDDEDGSHEDTPMWRLFVANSKMIAGSADDAIKEFDDAEDLIIRNDGKTKNYVSAMAVNDKYFAFDPMSLDRQFFSLYKAILFGEKSNMDGARTEFNRTMQYQENWLNDRKKEIAASTSAVEACFEPTEASEDVPEVVTTKLNDLKGEARVAYNGLLGHADVVKLIADHLSFDVQNSGNINNLKPEDYQNAYITHLTGVFRWLNKDDGSTYFRDAAKINPENKVIAADQAAANSKIAPKDEVWVYVEDGLCPIREEVRFDLPLILVPFVNRYVQYLGIALPKLIKRDAAAEQYFIGDVAMEELERIDRLAQTEYDVYMHSAVKRDLLRCLLKAVPQVAGGVVADVAGDPGVKLGARAFQLAAAGYAAGSTQADCRTWRVLPKRVMVQHVKRPADGVITLKADAQAIQITVPEGNNIVWVRKVAAASPFVVRTINFDANK